MRNAEVHPWTFVLARRELASIRLRGRACRISSVGGRLWVTVSGRQEDYVLAPGETVTFTGRGLIIVEALRTATVRLEYAQMKEAHDAGNGAAGHSLDAQEFPVRNVDSNGTSFVAKGEHADTGPLDAAPRAEAISGGIT